MITLTWVEETFADRYARYQWEAFWREAAAQAMRHMLETQVAATPRYVALHHAAQPAPLPAPRPNPLPRLPRRRPVQSDTAELRLATVLLRIRDQLVALEKA